MTSAGRIYSVDEGNLEISGAASALSSLGVGIGHHLSGRENVFVVGALHGLKRDEIDARYGEIIAFAELDEATMRTPVRYYSAGMRSRFGFAIASTLSPEILLLDELLSVGDPAFREKSARKLRELSDHARCLVVSSHSIHFLKTSATLHSGWKTAASLPAEMRHLCSTSTAATSVSPRRDRAIAEA